MLGQAKPSFLAEVVLRAAQLSGTNIETTAAAMRAAARRPATQPNRKHKAPLKPSTKVAVAVGAAILHGHGHGHGHGHVHAHGMQSYMDMDMDMMFT